MIALLAIAALHAAVVAGGVHADVRMGPALVGKAQLRVMLRDAAGQPVRGARVSAHVDMASMDMDPGFKPLKAVAPGLYTEPIALTMPGHWHVQLRVVRSGKATQTFDLPVFIDLP